MQSKKTTGFISNIHIKNLDNIDINWLIENMQKKKDEHFSGTMELSFHKGDLSVKNKKIETEYG